VRAVSGGRASETTTVDGEEAGWIEGAATVREAAAWLKCSRRTMFRLIEQGEIPSRLVLGRRLVPVSWLKRLLPAPACGAETVPNRPKEPPDDWTPTEGVAR
jgi:excisionase family DNA binding protein